MGFLDLLWRRKDPTPAAAIPAAVVPNTAPLFDGEPIPVYPDRGPPVPAASPEQLIASQSEQLRKLHHDSALSHEEFDAYIMPAVRNYAAYVHLLPASEANHHCGQGGMFRHGLEVATNAARLCNNRKFAMDQVPSLRHHLEPRWRACALLGGMIHDMGKPLVDVGAIDDSGRLVWNPHSQPLWDWLVEHDLRYYRIQWRPGSRHKRHEAFNAVPIYRILPELTLRWLGEYGSAEPLDQLVMSLAGHPDPRNPLGGLIKQADSQSVERDLKDQRHHLSGNAAAGNRSLAARLYRAMHDLIEAGQWRVNRPGSPIWVTADGVFGLYPAVFQDPVDVLRQAGWTAIPHDFQPLLDLMADWGHISPNPMANGQTTLTWNLEVDTEDRGRPVTMQCHAIRFARNDLLPASLPPPALVPSRVLGADGKPLVLGTITRPAAEAPKDAPKETSKEPAKDVLSRPPPPAEPAPASANDPAPAALDFDAPPAVPPATRQRAHGPLTPTERVEGVPVPASDVPAPPERPLRDRASEPDPRVSAIDTAQANFVAEFPPVDAQGAAQWLHQDMQAPEGPLLFKIAEHLRGKKLRAGHDVLLHEDRVHLIYPRAFTDLGLEPLEVRRLIEERGWTDRNTTTRTTVDLRIGNKTEIFTKLTEDLSLTFQRLLEKDGIVLTTRVTHQQRVLAWGPFLDERVVQVIQQNAEDADVLATIFKKAVYEHACVVHKDLATPLFELPAPQVSKTLRSFLKTHTVMERQFKVDVFWRSLFHGPNALLMSEDNVSVELLVKMPSTYPLRFDAGFKAATLTEAYDRLFAKVTA